MKDIISIMTVFLLIIFSCKKDTPPIETDKPEQSVQDSISIYFNNDTIKFLSIECPDDHEFVGSLISVSKTQDSFGINRVTSILSEDSVGCHVKKLHIGIDITDKIENYPVTKEIMLKHLSQIQSKTSVSSRFMLKFTDGCLTYENFERLFNNPNQIYSFSNNDKFNFDLDEYNVIEENDCVNNSRYFLVEMKGSFIGYLYTTPNVINKDSIFIECPNFKIRVLHSLNN